MYSCHILIKLEFFWQIFKRYSNTKFHENPCSGSQVVTHRHDKANGRFLQFCKRA